MLVDGKWVQNWQPVQAADEKGRFVRQVSSFRHWITPDGAAGPTGDGGFKAEPGRYHLYVSLMCPWASRTLMVRALKNLEDTISVSVLNPALSEQGWRFGGFEGAGPDPLNGAEYLHEIYTKVAPAFTGRATVPVLWDKQRQTIVNNESADIIVMLNSAFDAFGNASVDLYPARLRGEMEALNTRLYTDLNNGVYKAGFASGQGAYDEAVAAVFAMLDDMEARLGDGRRFLFGDQLTLSDVRVFVTLIRFDAAYHGLFKCNLYQVREYAALSAFMARILDLEGIADTVSLEHIKAGYYAIKALNPVGIVPAGPA
jgi:glutathionyl-hydroquinone reductase